MWRFARTLAACLLIASPCAVVGACAGETCERNSDCVNAQCISGECVSECKLDIDCDFGLVCNVQVGRCDPPTDGGAGTGGVPPDGSAGTGAGPGGGSGGQAGGAGGAGGAPSGGGSGGGGAPGGGGATSGGGGAGGSGGATAPKLELDLCQNDGECGALVCRPYAKGLAKRCTRTCASTASCPSGARCEAIGSEKYCVQSDVGRGCSVASDCQYACVTSTKYCTSPCNSGSDCPNGWGCMAVSGQKVCVKAAEPCDSTNTAACIVPAACDTSPSLVVAGCTLACSTAADCPQRAQGMTPWACNGLCRRPTSGATAIWGPLEGGTAPAQYACNAASQVVNVCGDGQHIDFAAFTIPNAPAVSCSSPITTDGLAGDACVDSCRYQGGCPWGMQCTALGSIGAASRIGLCLPALGGGEVGAACGKDGDCFFGYCNRNTKKCSRDCSKDGLCPSGSTCVAAGGPAVESLAFRRCE